MDAPAPPSPAVVTPAEAAALQLTPAQRAAIIQLTSGATRSAAAIAAGVTRTTLYKWLNHDPNFQAAFNAWHKDLITTAQGQLLAASHEAVNTVLNAIRRGDARLAWKLLESLGLNKLSKPGSTDAAQCDDGPVFEFERRKGAQLLDRPWQIADDKGVVAVGFPQRLALFHVTDIPQSLGHHPASRGRNVDADLSVPI